MPVEQVYIMKDFGKEKRKAKTTTAQEHITIQQQPHAVTHGAPARVSFFSGTLLIAWVMSVA
jgi:hypothetical protein